jgi:Asp/Glu/Hydantoin racemase
MTGGLPGRTSLKAPSWPQWHEGGESMRVQGGYNVYGFSVGILMLDTHFPRIPGDMGNASTFPFPVHYHRVEGASPALVVREGSRGLLPAFIEGAKLLEREGVRAITTNCGFLAKFQRELAAAVTVPVFTSSLMLVPMVYRMLPPGKAVGVLTIDAGSLTPADFEGAGITPNMLIAVAGLETEREFTRVLLGNQLTLDVEAARREHIRVAQRLCAEHPEVGAIVLECTNMPPYRADIQAATGLAVFDIVHLVQMVHTALGHGIPPRPVL